MTNELVCKLKVKDALKMDFYGRSVNLFHFECTELIYCIRCSIPLNSMTFVKIQKFLKVDCDDLFP